MSSLIKSKNKLEQRIRASKIKRFIEEHPETNLHSKEIKEVIDLYTEWRECYVKVTSVKFSRRVLYYVAVRMFCNHFNDTIYIAAVLNFIKDTDKGFCKFVLDENSEFIERYKMIDYFLHYAYDHKLLIRGFRIPCTKVYYGREQLCLLDAAVCLPNPQVLFVLLKYGALLSYSIMCVNPSLRRDFKCNFSQWSLIPFYRALVRIKLLNPNLLPIEELQLNPKDSGIYSKTVSCCELLMRDFPEGVLSIPNILGSFSSDEDYIQFVDMLCLNVMPSLQSYVNPPRKLKQICRLFIRKTLNKKWLLPGELYRLPIPETLKEYLDLYYD